MKSCTSFQKLIDEAERPDVFTLATHSHLSTCADCRQFADERTRLRELLGATTRVAAPGNFDMMLKAKLAQRTERKTSSWLNPMLYMKLGAATAALLVAVFAAQYSGFFHENQGPDSSQGSSEIAQADPSALPASGATPETILTPNITVPAPAETGVTEEKNTRSIKQSKSAAQTVNRRAPDYVAQDAAIVLVRGQNGEREVPIPTVSVGAQPILYAGKTVATASVRASF